MSHVECVTFVPMNPVRLRLTYRDAADLAAHLGQQEGGALLVPLPAGVEGLDQFGEVELELELPEGGGRVAARVLQVIPDLGVAVAISDPVAAYGLARGAQPAHQPRPPAVSVVTGETEDEDDEAQRARRAAHSVGAVSWPVERLQAEWQNLPLPERIRVARYGKKAARTFVLRQQDAQMHHFLLSNPHISVEEVTILAGMGNLDPALLKRLISSQEWTRHTMVARNLICHPKATLPQVTQLLDKLAPEELRRLTRTGKVRASVKALIIKRLEKRGGRR